MAQRWAIRLAIEGDLRFLSHHDMMRAIERVLARAKLPIKFTEGFNPHPVLSLVCPRPVGVAGVDELLVIALTDEIAPAELLQRLNENSPSGMKALHAEPMRQGEKKLAARTEYRLKLSPQRSCAVRDRLAELESSDAWPVERQVAKGGGKGMTTRRIDIRPLVAGIRVEEDVLDLTLQPSGDLWARPAEVLAMLGLDECVDLAAMVRTRVEVEG